MLYVSVSYCIWLGDETLVLAESCRVTHVLSAVSRQKLNNLIMEGINIRPKYALCSVSEINDITLDYYENIKSISIWRYWEKKEKKSFPTKHTLLARVNICNMVQN